MQLQILTIISALTTQHLSIRRGIPIEYHSSYVRPINFQTYHTTLGAVVFSYNRILSGFEIVAALKDRWRKLGARSPLTTAIGNPSRKLVGLCYIENLT